MKRNINRGWCLLFAICLYFHFMALPIRVSAQSTEIQQLLLNAEKLNQFKNILNEMKKGYTIVSNGYGAIKNIAEGNFSLHEVFMDGLMLVSPEVRKYGRIADIITYQNRIISEYKSAFAHYRSVGLFNTGEMEYISRVYGKLSAQSLDNLDDLLTVITSSKLRMSDEERLQAIDRIYADMQDKLLFVRNFNEKATVLLLQRQRESKGINTVKQYFNIN